MTTLNTQNNKKVGKVILNHVSRPMGTYTPLGSPICGKQHTGVDPVTGRPRSVSDTTPYGLPIPKSYPAKPVTIAHTGPDVRMGGWEDEQSPPEPSTEQRAVETAIANERLRTKKMEAEEINMTADELRIALRRERQRTARMAADLAGWKAQSIHSQLEAEMIEEGRINALMKKMDLLQEEKGRIIVELEREEEMLTNTLQKKLEHVLREKAELEKKIKSEQMKVDDIRSRQRGVAEALEEQDEMEEED